MKNQIPAIGSDLKKKAKVIMTQITAKNETPVPNQDHCGGSPTFRILN